MCNYNLHSSSADRMQELSMMNEESNRDYQSRMYRIIVMTQIPMVP